MLLTAALELHKLDVAGLYMISVRFIDKCADRDEERFMNIMISNIYSSLLSFVLVISGAICSASSVSALPSTAAPEKSGTELQAVDTYLRHIFSIYLGVRACADLRVELNEDAFATTVSLEEARKAMHAIEDAAQQIQIDTQKLWTSVAPAAVATARALKQSQSRIHVCQRMGSIFRADEINLQALLRHLGARNSN